MRVRVEVRVPAAAARGVAAPPGLVVRTEAGEAVATAETPSPPEALARLDPWLAALDRGARGPGAAPPRNVGN